MRVSGITKREEQIICRAAIEGISYDGK